MYTPVGDEDPDTDLGTLDIGQYLLVLASYQSGGETVNAVGISRYTVRADVPDDENGSPDFQAERTHHRRVPEDLTPGGIVGRVIVDRRAGP